ncbi:MAG: DUF6580 family putative transport protein [Sphingomicrobium sp.]
MSANHARLSAIVVAILAAAALRLVPHPPNFTPIGAMALFGGAYLGRRAIAFAAPLGALLLSDLVLGFYSGMAFQYVAVALTVALGWAVLYQNRNGVRVGGTAVAASVLFFVISNLGVWAGSGMYPHTLAGLGACFVAAIPFFQNSLAGDLLWSGVLFGGFALLERGIPALREPLPAHA